MGVSAPSIFLAPRHGKERRIDSSGVAKAAMLWCGQRRHHQLTPSAPLTRGRGPCASPFTRGIAAVAASASAFKSFRELAAPRDATVVVRF